MIRYSNLEFYKNTIADIQVLYIGNWRGCIIFGNRDKDLNKLFMPYSDGLEDNLEEDMNRLKRRGKEYTLTKISQHECVSLLKQWHADLTDADIERAFDKI